MFMTCDRLKAMSCCNKFTPHVRARQPARQLLQRQTKTRADANVFIGVSLTGNKGLSPWVQAWVPTPINRSLKNCGSK